MRTLICCGLLVILAGPAAAKEVLITVHAGPQDRIQTPVCLPLPLPGGRPGAVALRQADGGMLTGQLTRPGLLTEASQGSKQESLLELHFILPELKAGASLTLQLLQETASNTTARRFTWKENPSGPIDLLLDGKPVLHYENAPLDESTKEKRELTFKVYHHVYDLAGKAPITKGPGGLFTHHRGLFYGFKATYGEGKGITADTWHCPPAPNKMEAHLAHEKFVSSEAGPVLGRHRVQIGWHGTGKERFAVEEREYTVYNVPGGRMIEFASKLTSVKGKVKVDGDPQHAGFHFRANNEVAEKTKGETYYLRPDGQDKPGATRNWPAQKAHANLPWNAMSFVVGGQRYTAAYLDRPTNPKEARYSERDYGRFGSYFVAECTPETPLIVAYRLWIQEGTMTGPGVAARSGDFVTPPRVAVK